MAVLHSPAYLGLSAKSVKLLFDLGSQFRGSNNGDLTAAWKVMKQRGWKSEETLHAAKRELIASGLIVETRKGQRPNKCSLYGLTWIRLHGNPKLDLHPTEFPFGAWKEGFKAAVRSKIEALATTAVVTPRPIATILGVTRPPSLQES